MKTTNSEQPFLNLPTIFSFMMVGYSICISFYLYYMNYDLYSYSSIIDFFFLVDFMNNGFLNQLFSYSIFYFFIGVVMLSFQRRYQVNVKNVFIIIAISTLYQVVNYFTNPILILFMGMSNDIYPDMMIAGVVVALLKLLFLIFLFFCIGVVGRKNRDVLQITQSNYRYIVPFLLTLLIIIPILAILIQSQPSFLVFVLNKEHVIDFSIILLPSLLTFVSVGVVFYLTYTLIKSCFISYKGHLPIKLFFRVVVWSYFYLIVFNIFLFIAFSYFNIITEYDRYFKQSLLCIGIMIVNGILIALFSYAVVKYYLNKYNISRSCQR